MPFTDQSPSVPVVPGMTMALRMYLYTVPETQLYTRNDE